MRFDGAFLNRGPGDAVIVASRGSVAQPEMLGSQRIFRTDGSVIDGPPAIRLAFLDKAPHGHWHAQGLTEYRLRPAGTSLPGVRGAKIGFCLRDDKNVDGLVPASTPRRYGDCGNIASTTVLMGLQAGFSDVYEAEYADQWIDITRLRPGRYELVGTVDPQNQLREADETNNTAAMPVRLPDVTPTLPRQRARAKEVRVRRTGRSAVVAYATLSHPAVVRGEVFLKRGTRVISVAKLTTRRAKPGRLLLRWNGRTDRGRLAPLGLYSLKVVVRAGRFASAPDYFPFRLMRAVRGR